VSRLKQVTTPSSLRTNVDGRRGPGRGREVRVRDAVDNLDARAASWQELLASDLSCRSSVQRVVVWLARRPSVERWIGRADWHTGALERFPRRGACAVQDLML
jgi:hypothetical protein